MFTFDIFSYIIMDIIRQEALKIYQDFLRIIDLEENQAHATDHNHYIYSHLQVEEPGGGAS